MSKRSTAGSPVTEEPSYWFFLMEAAKDRGDFERAAECKRHLERLGVCVIYQPQGTNRGGPSDAA